jgi:hypothetical protein
LILLESFEMASSVIRIAVLHFQHETVTFLRNDTTIDDFVYPGSPARGEALLASGPKSYMGGFVQVAREYDGVELVGIESPLWPKTGSGSGWVAQEAYETFVGRRVRSTASISACTARWQHVAFLVPRRSLRGVCARWSGGALSSPQRSTRTATKTRRSCVTRTWHSAASTSRTTTAICKANAPRAP